MRDAMRLMGTGDLHAATAALQRGLSHLPPQARPGNAPPVAPAGYIDADYRVLADANPIVPDWEPAPTEPVAQTMLTGTFTSAAGTRDYLVYAPPARPMRASPLLLMLHGCTQNAEDFARGTRMHLRAASESYVVVYPVQCARSNANGCWNWFRTADQQRNTGEAALLAALVSEMAGRYSCDPSRIYVAGLSAGGAMAVTLGRVYPDVFRGVGVHSGLPHACAHDIPTALAAMRKGGKQAAPTASDDRSIATVPTIVFHGDHDPTVNVRNATQVVADAMGSRQSNGTTGESGTWSETVTTGRVAGGHEFTTTSACDASGKLRVESWIVHGGGHAWFGGSPGGTFVDAKGPDATTEMLRFFRSVA
jgi:poly(hydroxyalkanoate) depolymerase family esterase